MRMCGKTDPGCLCVVEQEKKRMSFHSFWLQFNGEAVLEIETQDFRTTLPSISGVFSGISGDLRQNQVQAAFDILRESAADRATNLQKEISNAQNLTSLTKEQWKLYMEETENNFQEDTVAVESRRCSLEEGLKDCIQKAEMDSLLWENAQDCLLSLGRATISSMESIVRNGMEVNQLLRANFSSTATTALEDFDVCSKNLHSSFHCYLKLHNDASENINSIITPSLKDIWDLKNGHYHKIVEITDCADKCLEQEYMVDA